MRTALVDARAARRSIVVMVVKFDHALLHLLYQIRVGWLDAEVAAIVSNHQDSHATADYEGIPYHYLPVGRDDQGSAGSSRCSSWCKRAGAELVVLARYMQILARQIRDPAVRADHQHPPLVPAQLQGRQALPPGA